MMYQPKIADEHIYARYQWAKRLKMPMTRLVAVLLAHALARLEQGVENVSEPAEEEYHWRQTRGQRKARYGRPERKHKRAAP